MRAFELERNVRDVVRRHGMLGPGERVVVGVSGGPDSVALLCILIAVDKETGLGCKFHVAHLNHGLRGEESEEDERFVSGWAESMKLPFLSRRMDVRQIASKEGCAIEEAARRVRYAFFEEVAKEINAGVVAVGHTADDNAETVLHRIIRGTGLAGLSGIRPVRSISPGSGVRLVRPILYCWRRDILNYLKDKGLSYRIDSSNLLGDRLRNRIRLELLPLLEEGYNPRVKEALVRLGDTAAEDYDFLIKEVGKFLDKGLMPLKEGGYSIDTSLFKERSPFFRYLAVREVFARLGLPLKKMGYEDYKGVLSLLDISSVPSFASGGWQVYLEAGRLCFTRGHRAGQTSLRLSATNFVRLLATNFVSETVINIAGLTRLSNGTEINAEVFPVREGFLEDFLRTKTPEEEVFDLDKIELPLIVRTRRRGDRFWPLGAEGREKLKDFFINAKVPRWKRDSIPIVATKEHPIWVVGMRIDERVKITPETKRVLRLSLLRLQRI